TFWDDSHHLLSVYHLLRIVFRNRPWQRIRQGKVERPHVLGRASVTMRRSDASPERDPRAWTSRTLAGMLTAVLAVALTACRADHPQAGAPDHSPAATGATGKPSSPDPAGTHAAGRYGTMRN